MRSKRVYRLDITYPPGSRALGWAPEGWECPHEHGYDEGCAAFSWPLERLYLSWDGAHKRAKLLRNHGAEVAVATSLPVQWPSANGGEA